MSFSNPRGQSELIGKVIRLTRDPKDVNVTFHLGVFWNVIKGMTKEILYSNVTVLAIAFLGWYIISTQSSI